MELDILHLKKSLLHSKIAIFAVIVFLIIVSGLLISISSQLNNTLTYNSNAAYQSAFRSPNIRNISQNRISPANNNRYGSGEEIGQSTGNIAIPTVALRNPEADLVLSNIECTEIGSTCKDTCGTNEKRVGICKIGTAGQAIAEQICCTKLCNVRTGSNEYKPGICTTKSSASEKCKSQIHMDIKTCGTSNFCCQL